MLGQAVHVSGDTEGRLESGAPVVITADPPLTLVAAPSYAVVDETPEEARGALRVTVRVGPEANPSSFLTEVAWE